MPFCEHCGEEIGYLPFKCKYCGSTFCKKHRLPENHECTFELKHTPVVPIPSREAQPMYQNSRRTPQRSNEIRRQKEIRKYLRQQRRQSHGASGGSGYRSGYGGGGSPELKATNFLIIMIVICSITAFILSYFMLEYFISFSLYGLFNLYLWTIFTSMFVSSSGGDLFGILFLFILIFFLYNIARTIELRFGSNFIIQLYIICTAFTALLYLLIRFLLIAADPTGIIYIFPIGLATGGILGLISFIIYFTPDQEMTLFCFFIPVRMKGRTLLVVLILMRVIPGLFLGLLGNPLYFALYFPDIGGIIAAYLVFYFKFKKQFK